MSVTETTYFSPRCHFDLKHSGESMSRITSQHWASAGLLIFACGCGKVLSPDELNSDERTSQEVNSDLQAGEHHSSDEFFATTCSTRHGVRTCSSPKAVQEPVNQSLPPEYSTNGSSYFGESTNLALPTTSTPKWNKDVWKGLKYKRYAAVPTTATLRGKNKVKWSFRVSKVDTYDLSLTYDVVEGFIPCDTLKITFSDSRLNVVAAQRTSTSLKDANGKVTSVTKTFGATASKGIKFVDKASNASATEFGVVAYLSDEKCLTANTYLYGSILNLPIAK